MAQGNLARDGDGPFGADFDTFHATRTEVRPNSGDSPELRLTMILFPVECLMHDEDGGVADAEAPTTFPRVHLAVLSAFCVVDDYPVPSQG